MLGRLTCRQGSGHERRLHCQKHEQNADRSHESGDSPPPWKKWYCGMVKFVRMRWIVFHSSVSSTELEMQLLWSRAVRRKISGARIWHHGRPLSSLRIYCSTHAHQILAARKPASHNGCYFTSVTLNISNWDWSSQYNNIKEKEFIFRKMNIQLRHQS